MPYVYLVLSVFMSASASVFGKIFHAQNRICRAPDVFYNFFLLLGAAVGWSVLYATDFSFESGVLWYAALFAASYIAYNVGIINALRYGPATLTTLLVSLSLFVTTVWGFAFWNATFTLPVAGGLILVACAIFLCLYTGGTTEKTETRLSPQWLFYVSLAFFGNAGCTILQRTQQMHFDGRHGNMLMFFAMLFSFFAFLPVYLKSDRTDTKQMLRSSWAPILAGVCNLLLNVFVILLASTALSPSLIYPVIGVGGLAVVTVFSLFVFKEKMRWWQWIGVGFGAAATVLLSL